MCQETGGKQKLVKAGIMEDGLKEDVDNVFPSVYGKDCARVRHKLC